MAEPSSPHFLPQFRYLYQRLFHPDYSLLITLKVLSGVEVGENFLKEIRWGKIKFDGAK